MTVLLVLLLLCTLGREMVPAFAEENRAGENTVMEQIFCGSETKVGPWLNRTENGYFRLTFHAGASFSQIRFMGFAGKSSASCQANVNYKLYRWEGSKAATLDSAPVTSDSFVADGDGWITVQLGVQTAGQYIFVLEYDAQQVSQGSYFVVGTSSKAEGIDVACETNAVEVEGYKTMAGYLGFTDTPEDGIYYKALLSDSTVPTDPVDRPFYDTNSPYDGGKLKVGPWLNRADNGYFRVTFHANADFTQIRFTGFASSGENKPTVRYHLYRWDTNQTKTLAGEPVSSGSFVQNGDGTIVVPFGVQPAGQYIFVLSFPQQSSPNSYFAVGMYPAAADIKVVCESNAVNDSGLDRMNGAIGFVSTPIDGNYYNDLLADQDVPNTDTGDPATTVFSFAILSGLLWASVVVRRRRGVQ